MSKQFLQRSRDGKREAAPAAEPRPQTLQNRTQAASSPGSRVCDYCGVELAHDRQPRVCSHSDCREAVKAYRVAARAAKGTDEARDAWQKYSDLVEACDERRLDRLREAYQNRRRSGDYR